MITTVILVVISVVLFNHLGLADKLSELLSYNFKVISCPKCFTFWSVLAVMLWNKQSVIIAIGVAFVASYCALWIDLVLNILGFYYNKCYECLRSSKDPDASSEKTADTPKMS